MKKILSGFLILYTLFMSSCWSDITDISEDINDTDSIGVPIKFKSPIPLQDNWHRDFVCTYYDSTGFQISGNDTSAIVIKKIEVIDTFVIADFYDTTELNSYELNYYFYTYRWTHESSGKIIAFYQPYSSNEQSGIVVLGEFSDTDTTLQQKPSLWIPYPITNSNVGDTLVSDSLQYEYFNLEVVPDQSGTLTETYCYRVGTAENYHYYYYEISRGLVSVVKYSNGKRSAVYRAINSY